MSVAPAVAREFEIGGAKYSASRMGLFDQNTVIRKLSGVLMWMVQARAALKEANDEAARKQQPAIAPPSPEAFAQAIVGMSNDLSRADLDTAYTLCLNTVQRRTEGGGWQRIWVSGLPMFEDIDLMAMQQIVYEVLVANGMIDFFGAGSNPPSGSSQLDS